MKVVFIFGTTASGKSQLGIELAQKYRGAILNCDSVQCYQGLKVGSALPSAEDFAKVPHYLFEFVPKGQKLTAGEYSRAFFNQIEELKSQFSLVFVVGGTGFYFQAIEKGMYSAGAADADLKLKVEQEIATPDGAQKLFAELLEKDPQYAQKISANDHYRLGRAIEILRTYGRSVTEVQEEFKKNQKPFPFPLLKLGIRMDKDDLRERIALRTKKMLKDGFIQEVRGLLSEGLIDWEPLQSVGYREVVAYLNKKISTDEELEELIIQSTMQLAKKQRTWFQRDQEAHWLEFGPGKEVFHLADEKVAQFVNKP